MTTIQIDNRLILLIIAIFLVIIWILLVGRFWLRTTLSGVRITPTEILLMRIRKTPVNLILTEQIKAAKTGIFITRAELEACYLSGGDVKNVVNGLIFAKNKGVDLSIKEAMQLDLQKLDIERHLRNK